MIVEVNDVLCLPKHSRCLDCAQIQGIRKKKNRQKRDAVPAKRFVKKQKSAKALAPDNEEGAKPCQHEQCLNRRYETDYFQTIFLAT